MNDKESLSGFIIGVLVIGSKAVNDKFTAVINQRRDIYFSLARSGFFGKPPLKGKFPGVHLVIELGGYPRGLCWVWADNGWKYTTPIIERERALLKVQERGRKRTPTTEPRKVFAIPIVAMSVCVIRVIVPQSDVGVEAVKRFQ